MTVEIKKSQIKSLVKESIVELVEEKNKAFFDALNELIEDIGLTKAMDEARGSRKVSRKEIFKTLKR